MTVRVKICGITSYDDAAMCVDEGAHALGFNFFPPSPRCITPAAAWDIIRRLPPYVERIGVFVDWEPNAVAALADALRLSGVQLHGAESPDDVEELSAKYSVVKALPVKQDFRPPRFSNTAPLARFCWSAFIPSCAAAQANRGTGAARARRASTRRLFSPEGSRPRMLRKRFVLRSLTR